jgi:alpha/beta hydrolase fold
MHGFPDNVHLYDRLSPYLSPPRRVVLFDFLGWGSSDKPSGYPYTTDNQVGDLDAVITQLGLGQPKWSFYRRLNLPQSAGRDTPFLVEEAASPSPTGPLPVLVLSRASVYAKTLPNPRLENAMNSMLISGKSIVCYKSC